MRYTFNDFRIELYDIEDHGVVDCDDVARMLDALEHSLKEA